MGAGQVCSLTSLQCAHLRKPTDVCERHSVIGMKLALAHQSRVSPAHSSRGRGKTVPPCIRTVVQRDVRVPAARAPLRRLAPPRRSVRPNVIGVPTSMSALGGQIEAMVRTSPECAWSATTNATWLQVQPASGQGEVAITLQVAENKLPNERIGAIHVNGLDVMLAQAAFVPPPPPAPAPEPPDPAPTPSRPRRPSPPAPTPAPVPPAPTPDACRRPSPEPDACPAGPEPDACPADPEPDACAADPDPDACAAELRRPTPEPPTPSPTPVPPAPTPTPVPPSPDPDACAAGPDADADSTSVAAAFSSTIQWNRVESDGHVPGAVVHRWRSFGSDGQRDAIHPRQL